MKIGAIFGLAIIIIAIILWIIFALNNLKIAKHLLITLLICIFSGILLFAYFFDPVSFIRFDLQAHYEILDEMTLGGWSYTVNQSQYSDLFIYNTYAYLITLTGNYALLQTIPLLIDFLIFVYIYFDIIKRQYGSDARIDANQALFLFFLWITVFGLKLAVTGIRCVLATALCALAIYNEYIVGKKTVGSVVLYAAALLIHNFALMIVLLRIFSLAKRKENLMTVFLIATVILRPILAFLNEEIDSSYLHFIFARALEVLPSFSFSQIGENSGAGIQLVYIGFIIIDLYLIYISRYMLKHTAQMLGSQGTDETYGRKLYNFCYTVGLIGIFMAANYLFMERYMYIVAWALLMVGGYYSKTAVKKKDQRYPLIGFLMICVLLFVFFFNDIYIFMVHYVGYYFFAM